MEAKAILQARGWFERAAEALYLLKKSKQFIQVERHWTDFVVCYSLIFDKLKAGSRGTLVSRRWFDTEIAPCFERDPLLRYIRQGRNALNHTVQEITRNESRLGPFPVDPTAVNLRFFDIVVDGNAAFSASEGESRIRVLDETGNDIYEGPSYEISVLTSFINRGVVYNPPHEHLGNTLPQINPVIVAGLALAFAEDILVSAPSAIE